MVYVKLQNHRTFLLVRKFIYNSGSCRGNPGEVRVFYPAPIDGSSLSAMIFGNFNDLVVGEWGSLDVIFDPYTNSTTGAMRVTAFMDVDVAVRHAESFAAIQDLVTT